VYSTAALISLVYLFLPSIFLGHRQAGTGKYLVFP
jgi:hypothetical protein